MNIVCVEVVAEELEDWVEEFEEGLVSLQLSQVFESAAGELATFRSRVSILTFI